jgi:hypothetical protein
MEQLGKVVPWVLVKPRPSHPSAGDPRRLDQTVPFTKPAVDRRGAALLASWAGGRDDPDDLGVVMEGEDTPERLAPSRREAPQPTPAR